MLDAGTTRLVEAIRLALPSQFTTENGRASISLCHVRNQSRSTHEEFRTLCRRLHELFVPHGRRVSLDFTDSENAPVQYILSGTAYLITAGGSDQWEIYFQLHPADRPREVLWENEAPLRLLRQPHSRGDRLGVPAAF